MSTRGSWYHCECKAGILDEYHPHDTAHVRRCRRKAYVEIRIKGGTGGWYRYCRPCAVAVLANPLANPLEHREMAQ